MQLWRDPQLKLESGECCSTLLMIFWLWISNWTLLSMPCPHSLHCVGHRLQWCPFAVIKAPVILSTSSYFSSNLVVTQDQANQCAGHMNNILYTWGITFIVLAVRPFHSDRTPLFLTTCVKQSIIPEKWTSTPPKCGRRALCAWEERKWKYAEVY